MYFSSPVVRPPQFLFTTHEQLPVSTHGSALEDSGAWFLLSENLEEQTVGIFVRTTGWKPATLLKTNATLVFVRFGVWKCLFE